MIEIYKIKKVPLNDLIKNNYNLELSIEDEEKYLIQQQKNALFYQLELLRGYKKNKIDEVIFIQAKNKKKKDELVHILKEGFICNGVRFKRFGKSASQAKNGITVFISEEYCNELINRSFLDTKPNLCVISKYESYRNLVLSACEMIDLPLPYIIIIDDYETIVPNQHVRTVSTKEATFNTGEKEIKYNKKYINEDVKDIEISPFDGMGIHTKRMSKLWAKAIGLKYIPISYQIRLPFIKGMSTEAPMQEVYNELGITKIKDIFGKEHNVSDIDCIWTKSMWKGYKTFVKAYGKEKAWNIYIQKIKKYKFKLGFSKYSHRIENLNLYNRLNFQYLQCHNFLNKKYLDWFNAKDKKRFDFSIEENKGKIVKLAEYSTDLFTKIINGDKLYSLKFLGLMDNNINRTNSNYIKAILINDVMLQDICVRKTLLRMLKKSINQLKYGKIYAKGFYHVVVGDIKGFLEYAGGLKPEGCLGSKEIYCPDLQKGDCVSMRSPLVDKSEVNKVQVTTNDFADKYLQYFKGSDIVMFSMKDISLPQQGGADEDGDIVDLCQEPIICNSVYDYPIIVDMTDKATTKEKEYNLNNIIEYECNTRDSRIGEITNVATSILNNVTDNKKWQKKNDDNIAILRITQGKEIDYIKTGVRWNVSRYLRNKYRKIPYFLLYSYPKKHKIYNKIKKMNKSIENKEDKVPYNAYKSASPMNELCDYICQWEKDNFIWNKKVMNTGKYLIDEDIKFDNIHIKKDLKKIYKDFTHEFYNIIDSEDKSNKTEQQLVNSDGEVEKESTKLDLLFEKYRKIIKNFPLDNEIITNYLVQICYEVKNRDKVFCWSMCGEQMLKNLKKNSDDKNYMLIEAEEDDPNAKEFLGRYYKIIENRLEE